MKFKLFVGRFFCDFYRFCLSWPGLLIQENWKYFNEIIAKSAEDKISIKALLEVSPSYFIKSQNKNMPSKLRIVADACFR